MRPCRSDHPLRHVPQPHRIRWAVLPLMLCALLSFSACTTDARIEPTSEGALTFAGQAVGWEKLLDYPEFRQDVLGARSNRIQWQLVDAAYEANPIPIPPEYMEFQFTRIYKQFGGGSLEAGETAFKTQYKIGTVIPEDRFQLEVLRAPKLEALVLQEHPVPEESIREEFDRTPQDQLFQMFGPALGMSEPGTITYDQVKWDWRSMMLQQRLGQYTADYLTQLVADAEKEGRLVINRLDGEVTPPAADETEAANQALPESLSRAAARLREDRAGKSVKGNAAPQSDSNLAYTLDGKPELWSDILSDPITLLGLRRHGQALAWILAIDYAFEQEGMTIDQGLLEAERDRMIRSIGGEEQMQNTLNSMSVSTAMFEDQIAREVKLRQLMLAAYPIEEQALRDRYASMQPSSWFEVYKPILNLQSASEVTYGRVRDQLYQDAVNSMVGEKKQAYMDTLSKLLTDRRVLLLSPDPMAPEQPATTLQMPQPLINGLPRLPYAAESVADALHLPKGDVKIPVTDDPEAKGGAAGGDDHAGHGH